MSSGIPDPFETTLDAVLGGRVVLEQPARGHRAGTDAILLAACVTGGGLVVDLGAGVGTAGLAVAARLPQVRLVLVERDPAMARLAQGNVERNGWSDRAEVVVADVTAPGRAREAAGLRAGEATWVIANPPFYQSDRVRSSDDARQRAAHGFERPGDLAAWLRTAASLLVAGGRLALVHRAEALPALFAAFGSRFGAIELRTVQPRAETPAHRVLVRARLGSRAPLMLHPALILHEPTGAFTPEAEALHRGEAAVFRSPRSADQ